MKQNWDELKIQVLGSPKKTIILSHHSPDGDSIGSSLGLYHYLIQKGHEVLVISPDPVPSFLHWLPGFDLAVNFESHKEQAFDAITAAELIFCLDFNTPERMGNMNFAFERKNKSAYVVNIDHHTKPEDFANFQISDTSASSTCQLVFEFIKNLESNFEVDQSIAQCLYTGILTDTGSFRFSATSSKTHMVAAELIATGIDFNRIYQRIYDSYSENRIRLLGFALKDKLNLYHDYSTAIINLTEKELSQHDYKKGDTEGLVNYPLSISWVKMSILLTQKDGLIKMSFRSKGNLEVNQIAKEHFEGGGHVNAAGGRFIGTMEDALVKLEETIPLYKGKIDESEL